MSCLTLVTAQSQNIEQDTTKANEYLQQAKILKDGTAEKIKRLEDAAALYELHDLPKKIISTNSQLVYQYAKAENEKAIELGQKNIELAKATFQNDKLPELAYTYAGMQYYFFIDDDFERIKEHGEIALQLLSKGNEAYFEVTFRLFQTYIFLDDDEGLERSIAEVRQLVEVEQNALVRNAKFTLYFGQFLYNYLYENNELIIIYGQQALLEIENNQLVYENSFLYEQIGIAYSTLGQLEKGIEWVAKLKNTDEIITDNLKYYEAMIEVYLANEIYDKAIPFLQKAILIREKIEGDKDNVFYLRAFYEDLVLCYTKTKQYLKAEEYLSKVYEYTESYEPYIVDIYAALLYNQMQQYDKGIKYIQKALVTFSPKLDKLPIASNPTNFDEFDSYSHHWVILALKTKAELLLNDFKNTKETASLKIARQTILIGIDFLIQLQENNSGYEVERLHTNKEISIHLQLLQDIEYEQYQLTPTKEQLNTLFKTTERYKALTLLETVIPQELPKAVAAQEQGLVSAIWQLEQKITSLKGSSEDSLNYYQKQLTEATYRLEKFQVKLLEDYPKHALASYYFRPISIIDIQKKLPQQSLWIEYAYDKTSTVLYIYAISSTTATLQTIPMDSDFFSDIQQMQVLLKDRLLMQTSKQKSFITTSHRLYQKLLLPIEAALEGVENLYIVPEQVLFNLPFEVLLSDNTIKPYESLDYMIRDYAMGYHYSATTFFTLKSRKTVKDKSLLAFAPVFNNSASVANRSRSLNLLQDSMYQSVERNQFVPLPNSKEEVETIHQLVVSDKSTVILLEEQATKANLIKFLNNQPYQYIHLATHGLVNYDNYKFSALGCFGDKTNTLLFANEIVLQKINADLVVLSSCESGVGQLVGSEGLIALNRSFIDAGAKNVIFSLWKVSDKYTSELMINFYKNQTESITYMKALQLAKLQLLEGKYSTLPYYWAAFVLIGE